MNPPLKLAEWLAAPRPADTPIAWLDDGTCRAGSEATAHRAVTNETRRDMPASVAASFSVPLYALPGAQPKLDEIKNALHRALELGKRETWTGAKKYRSREDQSEEQQCWVKVWNLLDAKGE